MAFYELDYDEGIVLQSTSAQRNGPTEDDFENEELTELVITNKRIIYVSEVSAGFFKTKTEITQVPISSIKVINGVPQVKQIKHDMWGKCIQIQFTHGVEYWTIDKREAPQWVEEINRLLGVEVSAPEPVVTSKKEKKNLFEGLTGAISGLNLQSAIENAQSKIAEFPQQMTEKIQTKIDDVSKEEEGEENEPYIPPVPEQYFEESKEVKTMFCPNCGTKLNEGAKFCHGCGTPVGSVQPTAQVVPPVSPAPLVEQGQQRRQEYVGRILKCPHCGAVITETTVVCPDCGMHITGRSAVSSVQAFKDQLMAIELTRKKSKFMDVYTQSANPADTQKLSLIRSFPIPNTIDDIQEFMLLAIANIDVKLSKNTAGGKFSSMINSGNVNLTIQKTISDAWVSKMKQAYQKAEISFANEPIFSSIQGMYFDKLNELKIKH